MIWILLACSGGEGNGETGEGSVLALDVGDTPVVIDISDMHTDEAGESVCDSHKWGPYTLTNTTSTSWLVVINEMFDTENPPAPTPEWAAEHITPRAYPLIEGGRTLVPVGGSVETWAQVAVCSTGGNDPEPGSHAVPLSEYVLVDCQSAVTDPADCAGDGLAYWSPILDVLLED